MDCEAWIVEYGMESVKWEWSMDFEVRSVKHEVPSGECGGVQS